ncbi:MAG: hypothetical protein LBS57_08055 [Treponema sp.]|nr:hypothetical protein [Treponema sp.]
MAALGAWRWTQGIYRFHPELYSALADTAPSGDLPAEVLLRLPEWSLYIETPGMMQSQDSPLDGVFVYLDVEGSGTPTLRFVLNGELGPGFGPILPLTGSTIRKSLEIHFTRVFDTVPDIVSKVDFAKDDVVDEHSRRTELILPYVLYICADEADISGHVESAKPHYPVSVKTKKGLKLFPPDKPKIWKIGEDVGKALIEAKERFLSESRATAAGDRAPMRPHIRRAHWHGYWTGPRKPKPNIPLEEQQRRYGYLWLPPTIVGVDD